MRLYLDTSVFVSITTNEAIAPRVQLWFAAQDVNDMVISDWVLTEFYAAVAFKQRTTQISPEMRVGAEKLFEQYVTDSLDVFAVSRRDFQRAGEFAGNEALKLRAGDALHLAIAERLNAQICTLDKRLFAAAGEAGLSAYMP